MPMYEYQCNTCGAHKDKIVSFSDADKKFPCEVCEVEGAEMERVEGVYATGHQFKGKWFKNTGGY